MSTAPERSRASRVPVSNAPSTPAGRSRQFLSTPSRGLSRPSSRARTSEAATASRAPRSAAPVRSSTATCPVRSPAPPSPAAQSSPAAQCAARHSWSVPSRASSQLCASTGRISSCRVRPVRTSATRRRDGASSGRDGPPERARPARRRTGAGRHGMPRPGVQGTGCLGAHPVAPGGPVGRDPLVPQPGQHTPGVLAPPGTHRLVQRPAHQLRIGALRQADANGVTARGGESGGRGELTF